MGTSRAVAAVACAAMLLGGCASVRLPDSAGNSPTITDFAIAEKTASDLAKEYLKLANESRGDMMWTELPIIGTALLAVTAVSFGWHADYAKAAAVGAGGLTAINAFTQPRQGVKRNVQAMAAMSCVARIAAQGDDIFKKATSAHLNTLAQVDGLEAEERKGLERAAEVAVMGHHRIGSTIDSINADILVRATNSMTAPSFDELVKSITASTEKTVAAKAGTGAAGAKATQTANVAGAAAQLAKDARASALTAAGTLDPADVQRAVDYAAELDQQLTLCEAKAKG